MTKDKDIHMTKEQTHSIPLRESFGMSFDANFGFATIREIAHTLKIGTAPEWKNGLLSISY